MKKPASVSIDLHNAGGGRYRLRSSGDLQLESYLRKINIRLDHHVEVILKDIQCDECNDLDDLPVGESGMLEFRRRAIAILSHKVLGEPQRSVHLGIGCTTFAALQNMIVC